MNAEALEALWADGHLRAPDEPVVRAGDPGFLLGLAVFETLLFEEGVLYYVDEHIERFERGAAALGLPAPPWSARGALAKVAEQLSGSARAVRLTLTPGAAGKGPSLLVTARAWTAPDAAGIGTTLVARAKLAQDSLESLKTSSRLRNALARQAAQKVGAWEALLGTDEGDVAEGTVSNLFAVLDGELVTPPCERGALPGIVRQKLIGTWGPGCSERSLRPEHLARASEVFLTSSLARIAPVLWIRDLVEDLPGAAGPAAKRAAGLIEALEKSYAEAQAARRLGFH